jgi:hypothetical protein
MLVPFLVSPFFAQNYRVSDIVRPSKLLVWKSVDIVLYMTYDLKILCVQGLGAWFPFEAGPPGSSLFVLYFVK